MKITDNQTGDIYEYTPSNGLISKNDTVLSGEAYEPVFGRDADGEPVLTGILFVRENKFLSLSGNKSNL